MNSKEYNLALRIATLEEKIDAIVYHLSNVSDRKFGDMDAYIRTRLEQMEDNIKNRANEILEESN
jgi:hypothetical protein